VIILEKKKKQKKFSFKIRNQFEYKNATKIVFLIIIEKKKPTIFSK